VERTVSSVAVFPVSRWVTLVVMVVSFGLVWASPVAANRTRLQAPVVIVARKVRDVIGRSVV